MKNKTQLLFVVGATVVLLGFFIAGAHRTAQAEGLVDYSLTVQFGSDTSVIDVAQAIDVDGSVYLTGFTRGALPGFENQGAKDVFIRKYDSSGVEQWTDQFGTGTDDEAFTITVDSTGVYIAGGTLGVIPGETGFGGADAFIRKYDKDLGTELWTDQFGTDQVDEVFGVTTDGGSQVYVTGHTSGAFSGEVNLGGRDAFIREYASDGTEQ